MNFPCRLVIGARGWTKCLLEGKFIALQLYSNRYFSEICEKMLFLVEYVFWPKYFYIAITITSWHLPYYLCYPLSYHSCYKLKLSQLFMLSLLTLVFTLSLKQHLFQLLYVVFKFNSIFCWFILYWDELKSLFSYFAFQLNDKCLN